MTFTLTPVNINTDKWRVLIERVNELVAAANTIAITTNSNPTVGSATITGTFSANALYDSNVRVVTQSRTVSTGAGLTGGGSLANNLTISLNTNISASLQRADTALQPSDIGTTAGTVAAGDDGRIVNSVQKTKMFTHGSVNSLTDSGFYRLADVATIPDLPPTLNYGQMIVSRGNDTIAQIGIPFTGGPLVYRGGNNIDTTPSFRGWQTIPREADVVGPLGGTGLSRPFLARDKEKPWSVEEFGAYGTSTSNHTLLVRNAMNAVDAREILFPMGKVLNVEETITLNTPKKLVGGHKGVLRLQRGGAYVMPLFVVGAGAKESELIGMTFDQNSQGLPQASLGNAVAIAHLSAVPVMADYVSIRRCNFLNGWDNGLSIGRYGITGNGSTGSPYVMDNSERAAPIAFSVDDCYAYNCGIGEHTIGPLGRIGVGINVLTGSRGTVENCRAEYCHTGFATDYGGGAGAAFSNCISLRSRENAVTGNGGIGFYLADGPVQVSNCQAMFGDREGFVVPTEANGTILSNCLSYANKRHGYVLTSSHLKLVGCVSQADSLGNTNLYDGFYFNPYAEDMDDVQLIGCSAWGGTNRYGWSAQSAAPFAANVQIIGGEFTGVSGVGFKGGKAIAFLTSSGSLIKANPLGGSLETLGTWVDPFKMANSYLYIDDVGRLRIKAGTAPTSLTDGTIVGTQT